MKRIILIALIALGLTGIAGPDVGHAQENASQSTISQSTTSSVGPGPVTDTRAGGYAAVGCGIFGRALAGGQVHAFTIAGAVATCFYMIIDALLFG